MEGFRRSPDSESNRKQLAMEISRLEEKREQRKKKIREGASV